jgi:type II secretory pathway pseudopilin PulG
LPLGGTELSIARRGAVSTQRREVSPRLAFRFLQATGGYSALELGLAMALIGILLTLSWGWQGSVTRRRVQNAAYLLEGDLRLTQQTAVSTGGNGPQAELCLRPNGYDIYTVVYQNPVARATVLAGAKVKTVNAGQEYANGITITPGANATYTCTVDNTRKALVYLASGSPAFPDSNAHTITVQLQGQSRTITIQPNTGLAAVGP